MFSATSSSNGVTNYDPPKGVKATLTRTSGDPSGGTVYDVAYELTMKDGTKYSFKKEDLDIDPLPEAFTSELFHEQDRYGNAIDIAAFTDANGSGAEVKDALGRPFRLYEDETGRITKVIYGIWDELGNETSDVTREVRYLYEDKTNDFTTDTFTVVKYASNVVGEDGTMIPVPVELKTKYTYEDKRLTRIYEPNQINTSVPKPILENYYNASGALSYQIELRVTSL